MKKLLQIPLTIGLAFSIQSALPISSQAEIKTPSEPKESKIPEKESKIKNFVFDFDNTYDYAACLDVILLAYEQRSAELENVAKNDCATRVLDAFGNNISKNIALQLIESAHLRATEKLETPLYPSLGLRRRIAINLGYVYDMDKDNPDFVKYSNSQPFSSQPSSRSLQQSR